MEKRIRGEFSRRKIPWHYETVEKSEVRVGFCGLVDATILCGPTYPFDPPRILWNENCGRRMSLSSEWHWFLVCMRRKKNSFFARDASTCLCCQSPLCDWHVSRRLDEVIEYAVCVQDASVDPGETPWWFKRLPRDLVNTIVALAWFAPA